VGFCGVEDMYASIELGVKGKEKKKTCGGRTKKKLCSTKRRRPWDALRFRKKNLRSRRKGGADATDEKIAKTLPM